MNIIEQVTRNRRINLKKLTKDKLVDRCLRSEDYFTNLEDKMTNQENRHKEEMRGLRESYQAGADEVEEEYNKSASYQYVKGLLYTIEKNAGINERLEEELKDLRENGHEDLRKENQALRNKIVRMA